jgi:putative tryptophan/tyrosine transport system substrate-binding protein
MRRREFITLLGGAAAWPLAARAQRGERMRRIGILMPYAPSDAENQARIRAFKEELLKLGWTKGDNIQFDERWTTDNMELVRANATNLVELKPDIIVAIGGRVIPILTQMTHLVPIVVPGSSDPVGTGIVQSLARPGGNVTGFSLFEFSVFGKMLETLTQIAPGTSRVALVYNPDNPNSALYVRLFKTFAQTLSVQPIIAPVHAIADTDRAIKTLTKQPNGGVFFPPDITISALREQIVPLVELHRLPAIYADGLFTKSGGLVSYGVDRVDIFRKTASYVDRILRGEKAGDLPFQQPTKYELLINLKTAKALGLDVPPMLLARADEVIE